MAPPSPASVPDKDTYLRNEVEGRAAEEQASLAYYRQLLEQAREEVRVLGEANGQLQHQVGQLGAGQSAHEGQLAASLQEGQVAQQAALQQVQSANQAAQAALQRAVDAENRALEAKAMEAAAKLQQQDLRSRLLALATEGVPGTNPAVGGPDAPGNAAEGLAASLPGSGNPADPSLGEGPSTPVLGPPGGTAEGMEGTGTPVAPDQASGEEADPMGTSPSEGVGASPQGATDSPAQSAGIGEKKPGVSIKVGSPRVKVSAATLERFRNSKLAAALPSFLQRPEVAGALVGGALGLGAAGIEAAGHGPHLDDLRGRIAEGEITAKQPGLKGFARALELAKERALLTLGEATQAHPALGTAAGGALGASLGYGIAPRIVQALQEARTLQKGL